MDIVALASLSDNYIFVSTNGTTGQAFCVDPGEAKPVLDWLEAHSATLTHILCTHHHSDHTAGIRTLVRHFPEAEVIGPRDPGRIPGQTRVVAPGEQFSIDNRVCEVLDAHAHTRTHVAYHFPTTRDLFSGDTMFAGTCGAIFEGTLADMLQALKTIRALPPATKIWCAHEYSLGYLQNAVRVEPWNEAIKERVKVVRDLLTHGKPTVPLLLADEIQTNPYLHWDHPHWRQQAGSETDLEVFRTIAESDG